MLGAARAAQFPQDLGAEVAFVGRSNAGKSSALNSITQQRRLARVSKAPGRTQQINFFALDEQRRLVDLPGYGYAKAAAAVRRQWDALMAAYFQQRHSLKGVVLIMDIRHPLSAGDRHMLDYCLSLDLPVHILLTKADKLSRGAAANACRQVRLELDKLASAAAISVQVFSALKKTGLEELSAQLDAWLLA